LPKPSKKETPFDLVGTLVAGIKIDDDFIEIRLGSVAI
jgi:hypothetical protein